MEFNNKNVQKSNKKDTKLTKIGIILLICIVLIILFVYAYAKYTTTITGSATTEIASMICEMDVQASEANNTIINPYCIVKIKNYNENNDISETAVNFKVTVTPKENFVMPEYYWQDANGVIVAQSTEVTGGFKAGVKELKEYKIVFLNSGEEDITRLVDFDLVALQGNGEQ